MKSMEFFLVEDLNVDKEKIKLPDLTEEELNIIVENVEFTRHIQEINDLFRIFRTNLDLILFHYQLNCNDTIIKKTNLNYTEDDYIVINTLVINYISSAKTLIESIESFIKNNLGTDELDIFKNMCLNKIYDSTFSYRLLIRLRDYAQHGHLPVSLDCTGRYSFDLEQVLYTPHFNHNSKLLLEMEEYEEKFKKEYKGYPRVVFTLSIAQFQLCILKIYLSFLEKIKEKMITLKSKLDEIVKNKPSIIYNSNDSLNGLILFGIDKNDTLHCINPKDDSIGMVNDIMKTVNRIMEYEQKEFDNIKEL